MSKLGAEGLVSKGDDNADSITESHRRGVRGIVEAPARRHSSVLGFETVLVFCVLSLFLINVHLQHAAGRWESAGLYRRNSGYWLARADKSHLMSSSLL